MLSRKLAVPFGHRMGAAAVTFAVVALAFAPIRFVAAHEKDEASSDYQRAKELEKTAERFERHRPDVPFALLEDHENAHVRLLR